MKKLILISSLLLLFRAAGYGQIEDIRKIQKQLPFIKDSLRYADALNRLAILSYERNVDSTFFYTEKARSISDRADYSKGKADAANNLGIFYDMKGNLQLALRYYNDAYNRYNTIRDTGNMVQATMNIAMVYQEIGKDKKGIASFKSAIALGKRLSRDSIMSLVYFNYLMLYPSSIKSDSIPVYISRAKEIAKKYNDKRVLLAIQQLTADTYIKDNQREKGIAMLKQAADDALKNNLYFLSLDIFIDLGDQYISTDSAKAVDYFKQALEITKQKEYRVYTETLSRKLYNFYTLKKDVPKAFYYSRQLIDLHSEQEKVDNNSGIDYIEYALKDQQLESTKLRFEYEFWFLLLAVLAFLSTITILIALWRNWKRLKKTTDALRIQFKQSESIMEALDSMNKNYARLIKIVAHDLRNPISAINSISLMLEPEKQLPAEIEELMSLIQVSSKNSLDLINELLETDFDPQQTLTTEEINVDELLKQCTMLLSFRANEKAQQLILTSNSNVKIWGDREKLWRVINNLIVNAIKFSPEGSVINLDSYVVGKDLVIAIKDNGMGIPNEIKNSIFDPFTAARRPGTQGEQPFGLGLYISKQIIEAHHGTIRLESDPGKGTTFYVQLPLANDKP
jgi:signal transduction histidine kinase